MSLSKGVDYIARQRLLRQVYVLGPDEEPLLHDSIDDLKHWLYLTQSQFLHLMRLKIKWPGKITIIEEPRWNARLFSAIIIHLLPAKVSPRFLSATRSAPRIPLANYKSLMSTPHLYQVNLVEIDLDSTPIKVRVDSLVIVGNVRGIRGCIDISVVKQLSIQNAHHGDVDNVFHYASEFTTLRDLHIAQPDLQPYNLNRFPKTIKRLALTDLDENSFELAIRFRELLEYLEFAGKSFSSSNWPRRYVRHQRFQTEVGNISGVIFPKLKVFVDGDAVFVIDRILGEFYAANLIN